MEARGQLQDAAEEADRAVAVDPTCSHAHLLGAWWSLRSGRSSPAACLRGFADAVRLAAGNGAQRDVGDRQGAQVEAKTGSGSDRDFDSEYGDLGPDGSAGMGADSELESRSPAVAASAHAGSGLCHELMGDLARADESYARAIAVDERMSQAGAGLGAGVARGLGLVAQAAPQRAALWFRRG